MKLSDAELRQEWKQVAKTITAQDCMVCPDHCFLFAVTVTPKEDKKCVVDVYDGHDVSNDFYLRVRAQTGETKAVIFNTPVYFNYGIYVNVCGDTQQVMLHYLPVKE